MNRQYGKLVDLTHTITGKIPVFPGDDPPELIRHCTFEKDGFLETRLGISSHTGTHIDAPAHMLRGGKSLDKYPLDSFTGRAVVADVSGINSSSISPENLKPVEKHLANVDFVLIRTGWSSLWNKPDYLTGFPSLTSEAASMLSGFNLKGIGTDTISIDSMESENFVIHSIFMKKGILIIENLSNLETLGTDIFSFFCIPLKLEDADGSPVRAFAERF